MVTGGVEDHFLGFCTHCSNCGWGRVIYDDRLTTGMYSKACVIVLSCQNNFEAIAWKNKGGIGGSPADNGGDEGHNHDHDHDYEGGEKSGNRCVMMAGYSSGWFTESFGIHLSAVEVSCIGSGDRECKWLIASPDVIKERVEDYFAMFPDPEARKRIQFPEHGKSRDGSMKRENWLASLVQLHNIFENFESAEHRAFYRFLESEFCTENMDFFIAIRKHKTSPDRSHKEPSAEFIYENFIAKNAERMVNIPDAMAKKIEDDLRRKPVPALIFDAAEIEVMNMLKYGPFERFQKLHDNSLEIPKARRNSKTSVFGRKRTQSSGGSPGSFTTGSPKSPSRFW